MAKKEFMRIISPRQVVLVTIRAFVNGREIDNIIPVAWHSPLSFDPEMYGIVIGKARYSCELIRKAGSFVVNFISAEYKDDVLFCGTHSGRDVDKFAETRFEKENAEAIDCSRIKQALGFLECEVVNEVDVGDHVLFVGKVVNECFKAEGKRLFHLGGDKFVVC
ncbi:flavin reductase family protein [Candidatus Woesearchaeota archaeon]|nr:MAG: flavin reductase family protein [Candidatus Woesearchaeota archaeon]